MNKKKTVLIFFVLMVIFFIYYWYRTYSTINKIYEKKFGESPHLRKYFSDLFGYIIRKEISLEGLYINLTAEKVTFEGEKENKAGLITLSFPVEEINIGYALNTGCYYIKFNNTTLKPLFNFSFMIPEEIEKYFSTKAGKRTLLSEEGGWMLLLHYLHSLSRCARIFGENLIAFKRPSVNSTETEIVTNPEDVNKKKFYLINRALLADELARIARNAKDLNSIIFLLPFPYKDELTNLDIILSTIESYVFHGSMFLLEKVPDVFIDKFEEVKLKDCSKNLVYKRLKKLEKELIDTLGMNDTFDKIRKIRIKIIQDCSKELLNDTSCNFFDEISRERSIANVVSKHAIFASCLSSSLKNLTKRES
jgi:hypothetical protein